MSGGRDTRDAGNVVVCRHPIKFFNGTFGGTAASAHKILSLYILAYLKIASSAFTLSSHFWLQEEKTPLLSRFLIFLKRLFRRSSPRTSENYSYLNASIGLFLDAWRAG